jgi:hypothetical protein
MWNIEGKALGTVLGEFKDRFNCNSRAKKLVTDWNRVVLLEASNTSTKMGLIVKDCAAHVIDVEALDATAGDIVHLQAEEDILCDIFSGRYNPASALGDGNLAVFSNDRDKVKLEALAMVLWRLG